MLTCVPDVVVCLDSVTSWLKVQINRAGEQDFELDLESEMDIYNVKAVAIEM